MYFLTSNTEKLSYLIRMYNVSGLGCMIYIRYNTLYYFNGSAIPLNIQINNNTWYHLRYDYDTSTYLNSIYINKQLITNSANFYRLTTQFDYFEIKSLASDRDYTTYYDGICSTDLGYTNWDNYYLPETYDRHYYTDYQNLTIDERFNYRYTPVNSFDNTSYLTSLNNKTNCLNISDYDGGNNEQLGIEYNIQSTTYLDFNTNLLMDIANEGFNISFYQDNTLLTFIYASSYNIYYYDSLGSSHVVLNNYFYENVWSNMRLQINCITDTLSFYINNFCAISDYDLLDSLDYNYCNKIQVTTQYINVDYSLYIQNPQILTQNSSHIVKTLPDYNSHEWFNAKQLHVYGGTSATIQIPLTTKLIFSNTIKSQCIFQINENTTVDFSLYNSTQLLLKSTVDSQINDLSSESYDYQDNRTIDIKSNYGYTYLLRMDYSSSGLSFIRLTNINTTTTKFINHIASFFTSFSQLYFQIKISNYQQNINFTLGALDSNAYMEYYSNETIMGSNIDASYTTSRILETYNIDDSSYNNFEGNNQYNFWNFSGSYSYSISNKYMSDNLSNAYRPRQKLIPTMQITHPTIMNITTNSSDTFTGSNQFIYYGVFDVSNNTFIYLSCGIYWINLTINLNNFQSSDVTKYTGGSTSFSTSDTFLDNSNKFCVGVYNSSTDLKFIIRYKYSRYVATYTGISISDLSKPQFRINDTTFICYGLNYGSYPTIYVPNSYWYLPYSARQHEIVTYSTYITFSIPTLPNPYSGYRNLYNQILSFNTSQTITGLPLSQYISYHNFTYIGQNSTWYNANRTIDGISLFGYYEFSNFTFQYIHNISTFDYPLTTYDTTSQFGLTWIFLLEEPNPSIMELAITSLTPLIILLIFPYALGQRFGKTGSIIGLLFGFIVFGISRLISPIYTILLGGISIIILYVYLKNKKEGVNDIS